MIMAPMVIRTMIAGDLSVAFLQECQRKSCGQVLLAFLHLLRAMRHDPNSIFWGEEGVGFT